MPIGGNITGGGGGGEASSWFEEYVADFTTLGTASYAHDATVTLNGVAWLAETDPVAGGDPEGTINSDGSGLTILSDGDSVDNIIAGITCPTLSFKLLDAIPDLSNLDTIAIQVLVSELSTRDNSYEGYGTALYTPDGGGLDAVTKLLFYKNWCVPAASWPGSYDSVWWGCGGYTGTSSGDGGGGTIDTDTTSGIVNARNIVMETLFNFNGQTAIVGHTVSASTSLAPFTPFDKNRRYVAADVLASAKGASQAYTGGSTSTLNTTNPPTWSLQASTARFGIGAFTADSNPGDDFSVRFTRVRVLRLGGSGGGAG
jgi:hypothetical protein